MAAFGIELTLRIRNVIFGPNTTGIRASIQTQLQGADNFLEISQTETVFEERNVKFNHRCSLNYRFDKLQRLKIIVYGIRDDSEQFSERIGEGLFDLSVVISKGGELSLPIASSTFMDIYVTVPDFYSQFLGLQFFGQHMHGPDSLPLAVYFTLILKLEDRTILLHRSEVIKDNKYPQWAYFRIPLYIVQFYQLGVLQIHCYNQNVNASDSLIGYCTTSVLQLQRGAITLNSYMLLNSEGIKVHEKMSIDLQRMELTKGPTFFELLNKGTHLHLDLAIDMTASNGNPNNTSSLHYIHPHVPGPYVQAVLDVIPPFLAYLANNKIGALGFGAKVEPSYELSQCFFLNGTRSDAHVDGLHGLLDSYRLSRLSIQPFAPTDFSEVIYYVSKFAKAESRRNLGLYFVLIIMTDGGLSNPRRTIDSIVDCSSHPISIICVGIGENRDFANVRALESANLKHSDGRILSRQIFQFISAMDLDKNDGIALLPLQIVQWKSFVQQSS